MKYEAFQATASRYAAVMGRKHDVTVTFGGTIASTNGRNIQIPALPSGTVMSPWQVKVFGGYLDHEASHVRRTKFLVLQLNRAAEPLLTYLKNLVEDIRVEGEQIREYPGSKDYLDTLAYEVDKGCAMQVEGTPGRLLELLYKEAYAKYRNVDTGQVKGWLEDYPEWAPIAQLMATEMPRVKTTEDTVRVAKAIEKLIPPALKKQRSGIQSELTPATLTGDGQSPSSSGPVMQYVQGMDAAAQVADKQQDRKQFWQKFMKDLQDFNSELSGTGGGSDWSGASCILPPVSTKGDKILVYARKDRATYESTRASVSAEIMSLKKMLNIRLRSRAQQAWSRGLEEGILDATQLHQLVMGDTKVFMERREREIINTVVELVVDLSSSMSTFMVRQATIMLAEALGGVPKLKLEITGFNTNWERYQGEPGMGRSEGMNLWLFKSFDEPFEKARDRIGGLYCSSRTPLGDAYGLTFERVVARPERRKVLWLISDGMPCIDVCDKRHNELMLMDRVHKRCKACGVETVGLYIGTGRSALEGYVDVTAQVRSSADLAKVLLDMVRGMIQ